MGGAEFSGGTGDPYPGHSNHRFSDVAQRAIRYVTFRERKNYTRTSSAQELRKLLTQKRSVKSWGFTMGLGRTAHPLRPRQDPKMLFEEAT